MINVAIRRVRNTVASLGTNQPAWACALASLLPLPRLVVSEGSAVSYFLSYPLLVVKTYDVRPNTSCCIVRWFGRVPLIHNLFREVIVYIFMFSFCIFPWIKKSTLCGNKAYFRVKVCSRVSVCSHINCDLFVFSFSLHPLSLYCVFKIAHVPRMRVFVCFLLHVLACSQERAITRWRPCSPPCLSCSWTDVLCCEARCST